jgi:arsenate reductase-like glutaredoxin family protein
MAKHPILMNRPIVEVEGGAVKLCRPSDVVKELL